MDDSEKRALVATLKEVRAAMRQAMRDLTEGADMRAADSSLKRGLTHLEKLIQKYQDELNTDRP
jgi:hypothetical protein